MTWKKFFEPVTTKQAESTENQLQAINQQTQGFTQALENQTRAIEHNNNTLQKSIKEGIKQYDDFAGQEKITYGLGYTLTLKRNSSNDAILRCNAVDAAKVVVKDISWYIPHYVPSLENQQLVLNQI